MLNPRSESNSDDGGKIPLMTLNHFEDEDDDDDELDGRVVNGAVNGGRHSRHSFT